MIGIIVDCYSSSQQLSKKLYELGVHLIHVRSTDRIPDVFAKTYNDKHFMKIIEAATLKQDELMKLLPSNIGFVIAGSELGIALADKISENLGLSGNDTKKIACRCNKYLMMQCLMNHQIPTVREVLVDNVDKASEIIQLLNFPMVVKPTNSSGSEDVYICNSLLDLKTGIDRILNKKNILNLTNVEALAQECLVGEQYLINTISLNGRHFFTDIWNVYRIPTTSGTPLYDYEILNTGQGEKYETIKNYVIDVLNALGIKEGPGHTELYLTKKGPILLEATSKLQGGTDGAAIEKHIGESQISLTSKMLVDKNHFISSLKQIKYPKNILMKVNLISPEKSLVINHPETIIKKRISSYVSSFGLPVLGDVIKKTRNLITSPGHIFLVGESIDDLIKDKNCLRQLEKNGDIF